MSAGASGWLWFAINVAMVAALALAIAYGLYMWSTRRRSPALRRERDAATRRVYDKADAEEKQNRP